MMAFGSLGCPYTRPLRPDPAHLSSRAQSVLGTSCNPEAPNWVAVKELSLSYHTMDIYIYICTVHNMVSQLR